jgi:hypothetical protein
MVGLAYRALPEEFAPLLKVEVKLKSALQVQPQSGELMCEVNVAPSFSDQDVDTAMHHEAAPLRLVSDVNFRQRLHYHNVHCE